MPQTTIISHPNQLVTMFSGLNLDIPMTVNQHRVENFLNQSQHTHIKVIEQEEQKQPPKDEQVMQMVVVSKKPLP